MPLPEKIIRNKAIVALNICGFSQREIGELLGVDRRNVQIFVKKYKPRYSEEIINNMVRNLAGKQFGEQPTKLRKIELSKILKYKKKICQKCKKEYLPISGSQKYCLECGNIVKKEYSIEHRKKYYQKHKEEETRRKSIWYQKNKERIREHQGQYKRQKELIKRASFLIKKIPKTRKSINSIISVVAKYYCIKPDDIIGQRRKNKFVVPRMIAAFLMRDQLGISFPKIGQKLGGRNHTTVIYSYNKISREYNENKETRKDIENIKEAFL